VTDYSGVVGRERFRLFVKSVPQSWNSAGRFSELLKETAARWFPKGPARTRQDWPYARLMHVFGLNQSSRLVFIKCPNCDRVLDSYPEPRPLFSQQVIRVRHSKIACSKCAE
jgi:hypothetical protein